MKESLRQNQLSLKVCILPDANDLIRSILNPNPVHRITIQQILAHNWMQNSNACYYATFSAFEADRINKDFVANQVNNGCNHLDDIFKSGSMTNKHCNDSIKSLILTPYNSLIEDENDESIKIEKGNLLYFEPGVIDYDKQYEKNNNCEVDNGVYNKLVCESSEQSSQAGDEEQGNISVLVEPIVYDPNRNSQYKLHVNEEALLKVESFGFQRGYIIESLNCNLKNHASASYYMLVS